MRGTDNILYITIGGVDIPVGCTTSDGISESTDALETTTRDNNGWSTSRPTIQRYSIPISGIVQLDDVDSGNNLFSYRKLRELKRSRTIFDWKQKTLNGWYVDSGKGWISDISFEAPAEGEITFSANIVGFGAPEEAHFLPALATNDSILTNNDNEILIDK